MRRGLGLSIAWIGATIVSVVIAGAAVSSVRSQVTEKPTALGSPTAAALAVDTVSTTIQSATASSTVSTTVPATSSETVIPPISETIGSTMAPVPPPSPVTTQPTTSTKTYSTDGGTVRIAISDQSVTFSGAVPNPGWKVEIEHSGPEEVKVKFKQNDHGDDEIEFKAQFEYGELQISIDDH
ncbi:MAG: hypothetical protein M5U23_11050 [Acidimicrobiia bacterium]|nr:hypothetical protein [Acidimicrobiia bacterium]